MQKSLQEVFEKRLEQFVSNKKNSNDAYPKAEKKVAVLAKRSAEIVKANASGNIIQTIDDGDINTVTYQVHYKYLIKQKGTLYQEEEVEVRVAVFNKDILLMDEDINPYEVEGKQPQLPNDESEVDELRISYKYNRLKAVQYAERWWNTYNPAYQKFENDCTNFISQCLHAGGAPMRGYPNRGSGWWYRNKNWSYSWSVAHALRLYLGNSKSGLRTREVSSPDQLLLGDVICYDFEGDGRYNHNTIVTGKDAFGMPLVNAHTYNSRQRYWAYEDSSAYTPNIKYKFFTIVDG
ncbi:MAG: hypothetical protein K0Q87_278 [Neobacillus sp.]|nr:hypothetical protein [Neobacillus sp.]